MNAKVVISGLLCGIAVGRGIIAPYLEHHPVNWPWLLLVPIGLYLYFPFVNED